MICVFKLSLFPKLNCEKQLARSRTRCQGCQTLFFEKGAWASRPPHYAGKMPALLSVRAKRQKRARLKNSY